MTEKEFLIRLALNQYNAQYNLNILPEGCDVKSLTTRVNFDRSYEVWTNRGDDFVRMRMHLLFGGNDGISAYRVETDGTTGVANLTDEVFVSTGSIDSYWRDSGTYKFAPIDPDVSDASAIFLEDFSPILLENGNLLLEETVH